MEISRLIAEIGPQLIQRELMGTRDELAMLEGAGVSGDALEGARKKIEFLESVAPDLCNAAADCFQSFEKGQQDHQKVNWVANTAAQFLVHHQGEAMEADVDNAVRLAKRILDQAEKAFAK